LTKQHNSRDRLYASTSFLTFYGHVLKAVSHSSKLFARTPIHSFTLTQIKTSSKLSQFSSVKQWITWKTSWVAFVKNPQYKIVVAN